MAIGQAAGYSSRVSRERQRWLIWLRHKAQHRKADPENLRGCSSQENEPRRDRLRARMHDSVRGAPRPRGPAASLWRVQRLTLRAEALVPFRFQDTPVYDIKNVTLFRQSAVCTGRGASL